MMRLDLRDRSDLSVDLYPNTDFPDFITTHSHPLFFILPRASFALMVSTDFLACFSDIIYGKSKRRGKTSREKSRDKTPINPPHIHSNLGQMDICVVFDRIQLGFPLLSLPVVAVKTLVESIKTCQATTMSEFMQFLSTQANILKHHKNKISMIAGCDLFVRFVSKNTINTSSFDDWKARIVLKVFSFPFPFLNDSGLHLFSTIHSV